MGQTSTGTITFLFTDIEGSTRLWERFPDEMKAALHRHDAILRAAIEGADGEVVKTTGDGMMAVFRSAVDATAASLAAQRELAVAPWTETGPLRVRMGLHAGQAEFRQGDYFGPSVNRTARIMAAGHGGQVLLSASASALASERLPRGASLLDLGEHRLKDIGSPERIFQLVHPDLPSAFAPLTAQRPSGAELPTRDSEIVGREHELEAIRESLADAGLRLLTLNGPGGIGKTALAIRAARELSTGFADGVCFVDLSGSRDTDAVLVAIARAVGLGDAIARPLREELTDHLRDRRMLLILDNFEQVTEAASVVAQLLRDCPRLTIVVTSREALHVRAERVLVIPPLSLPPVGSHRPSATEVGGYEAVRLFVDRARAARPDFELSDENAPAVAEICRRLDGLPLAIELAAARMRLFSPEVLRDRLGDRLALLRSGPRDLPERQQTLRATMDWSYDLLEAGEQRLFELLAVFADADIAAVEAVAGASTATDGPEIDVLGGLAGLTEKSLVRQTAVGGAEPRFGMLETIREYAADRLAEHRGLEADARRAHAVYFADLAQGMRRDLIGNARDAALTRMAGEVENLRIGWRYWVSASELEQLQKMADSMLILNDARGWYLDTVTLTTDMLAVLDLDSSSPDRISQEIALRTSLARALMATKGFTVEVEDALEKAVELFELGTDARTQFSVLRGLATVYEFRAQFDKVGEIGKEMLELAERENDPRMLVDGHLVVGSRQVFTTDLVGGLVHFDQAIALFPQIPIRTRGARVGNDPRVACLTTSAFGLWLNGQPDRSVERATAAVAMSNELDHPFTSAFARFHSGLVHLWRREWDAALDRALNLLEIADQHDFKIWTAAGGALLGAAQVGLGRFDEGLANVRGGMDLYQGQRSPPVFWPLLLFLSAGTLHRAGRSVDAVAPLDASIGFMSAGEGTTIVPELHLLKGDLLAALGGDGAEHWYRLAHDHARRLDIRMTQLRAATRLAGLSSADGRSDDASELLGDVYATFTEGFDTADLVEAREVLAALAGSSTP